jgi:HlyD family secretion protein
VISAPVAGYMHRVELDVGDPVRKDQTIVELEPLRSVILDPRSREAAETSVRSAQALLRAAEERSRAAAANEEYARKNRDRIQELFGAGYVSKDALEQADSEAKKAEANRLSAEAEARGARSELDRARTALKYSAAEGTDNRIVKISTPVSGRVLKLHRESEGVVSLGDPIIDVGDPSRLEVEVEVLSENAIKIKPGTTVLFERWGGDRPLLGKVRVVEPEAFTKISSLGVEEQRVLVIADITSLPESWQKLGDRYRVEARFVIWEGENVLQVPVSALFRKGEHWAVFVMKNGKASLRLVEVGQRTGFAAEITSGLSEGEEVIIHPGDTISEGTRVKKLFPENTPLPQGRVTMVTSCLLPPERIGINTHSDLSIIGFARNPS